MNRRRLVALVTGSALAAGALVAAPATAAPATCPDLHILAVQGTGQSAPNAPTKIDAGMLSAAITPVLGAQAADKTLRVERTYVPYRANFGNRGFGLTTYRDSAGEGLNRLSQIANRVLTQCPNTKLAVLGYSQGGHVVDAFAKAVIDGVGAVTADSIALVVSYGSPTRAAGASLFPGAPGQVSPSGIPGIDTIKATKFADNLRLSKGQGIGPDVDQVDSFGPLTGRVAQFCIDGDLACSAPKSASLLRLGANIVEQSNLDFEHDPTGTASRLAAAVADTAVRGTAAVVNSDISGNSLADLQVNPNMSISQRLAQVSAPNSLADQLQGSQRNGGGMFGQRSSKDPRKLAEGADNPLQAIARIGTIALNTVSTFATAFLTADNIASMIKAGVAAATAETNPISAKIAGQEGTKLGGAALEAGLQAIPPATAITAVKSIFTEIINEVSHNADLPQLVMDARTWNQVAYHGGYTNSPVSTSGASASQVTANWLLAIARGYANARQAAKAEAQRKKGTTNVTAPYRLDRNHRTAPIGAIRFNDQRATRRDHRILASIRTPGPVAQADRSVPVAIANTALSEAQRMAVASDPRFVNPNIAQQLARYGSLALFTQKVSPL